MNDIHAQNEDKDAYITIISAGVGIPAALSGDTEGIEKILLCYKNILHQKFTKRVKALLDSL